MSQKYQFTRTVNVDGTLHSSGDVICAGDVAPGYFESCIRVGHLVAVSDQPDPAEVFAATMGVAPVAGEPLIEELLIPDPPATAPASEPVPSGSLVGPPGETTADPKPADSKHNNKHKGR